MSFLDAVHAANRSTIETVAPLFNPGDVVMLRSGGPLLSIISVDGFGNTVFIYFNSVDGTFVKASTDQRCLRAATTGPSTPDGANELRTSSVARAKGFEK